MSDISPRDKKGWIAWSIIALIILTPGILLMFLPGGGTPMCDGKDMHPGDVCTTTRIVNGVPETETTQTYEEVKKGLSNANQGLLFVIVGGAMTAIAILHYLAHPPEFSEQHRFNRQQHRQYHSREGRARREKLLLESGFDKHGKLIKKA